MPTIINKYNNLNKKTIFGFWLYIMSDCILFASLFATHIVLNNNYLQVSENTDIFNLTIVFMETFCLLLSSLTFGNSMMYIANFNIQNIQKWMIITLLLGLCFIGMESYEFHHLIKNGYNPCYNSFFSSFFLLIGTHGLHIIIGSIWIIIMIIQLSQNGLTQSNQTRLQCLSLFWHFLDIIWICIFTEIYLKDII